jgi:tetraacyldisaccharide 4'-kinase
MRGYGDDEPLVHRQLTPDALVVADPDRVAGARRARADGATALVLDDGFQHRRARRDVDLVIVAAEQGTARRRLPAGPLRESARALRRADALLITRKSATLAEAAAVAERWSRAAPGTAVAVLHLAPDGLRPVAGGAGGAGASAAAGSSVLAEGSAAPAPAPPLRGQRVLAVSAIGAPEAFEQQLRAAGADLENARFPDHHPFSATDIAALARRGEGAGMVVCTLKDAVKLGARWPRQGPPLWYLSQAVNVERGAEALHGLLDSLGAVVPPKF